MNQNTSLKIEIIKKRHQDLDDEVDLMNKKRYLTPKERTRLKQLKIMRLKCKDALRKINIEKDVTSLT